MLCRKTINNVLDVALSYLQHSLVPLNTCKNSFLIVTVILVKVLGKSNLFVTMTCNPTWPEIRNELELGQSPPDCLDIVVRIFELKLKTMMEEITKKNVMGETNVFYYTIKFKKGGLFHAHILLWLKEKVNDCDFIDKVVCAKILDLDKELQLYAVIIKHIMHDWTM